eukprot:NODE_2835_length_1480_cov_41.436993_g2451_i0.p1 GENE.NODE_2835_length_1480_cov_41.436993_g2451_i0~~NODE_2835_length_1480_cov_41.436993_g2451_i0.p1  ORF type:complete len:419 (-),score=103.56 NODE_2835_length_1480_cov_41.436993_g2451_i0:123-1379(-)
MSNENLTNPTNNNSNIPTPSRLTHRRDTLLSSSGWERKGNVWVRREYYKLITPKQQEVKSSPTTPLLSHEETVLVVKEDISNKQVNELSSIFNRTSSPMTISSVTKPDWDPMESISHSFNSSKDSNTIAEVNDANLNIQRRLFMSSLGTKKHSEDSDDDSLLCSSLSGSEMDSISIDSSPKVNSKPIITSFISSPPVIPTSQYQSLSLSSYITSARLAINPWTPSHSQTPPPPYSQHINSLSFSHQRRTPPPASTFDIHELEKSPGTLLRPVSLIDINTFRNSRTTTVNPPNTQHPNTQKSRPSRSISPTISRRSSPALSTRSANSRPTTPTRPQRSTTPSLTPVKQKTSSNNSVKSPSQRTIVQQQKSITPSLIINSKGGAPGSRTHSSPPFVLDNPSTPIKKIGDSSLKTKKPTKL